MAEREKVSGFRLPEQTLKQLDELIEKGVIKNRTEGVIEAVNYYFIDNYFSPDESPFLYVLNQIIKNPNTVKKWETLGKTPSILIQQSNGEEIILDRHSPHHASVHRLITDKDAIFIEIYDSINHFDPEGEKSPSSEENNRWEDPNIPS